MADQRIGANFSIDVTQLKAGLSTANKLIRESQSNFQKAAAGLDDWSKSEDGLKAKLKSLNEITDVQKKKVAALKESYEKLVKEGMDETSDRAITLRTQISKEEAALKSNEAEIEKQTTALKKLQAAGGDAGKALEDTGKDAAKSSEGFTVMRGALADLVSSGFKMAINGAKKLSSALLDVGKKADELNTLSKQSGFTTTELQRFEYAAELVDVSVDDIIGSAKKLKKNLVSNSADTIAAFERIGVSVRDDVTGELRDANTIFYEVVKGLQGVENETERDTLAMQLLGKNADSLAGIIDDGGEALRKYGDEAEELGIVLSEEAVDSANKFNDSIDKIKGTAQGVFAQIGAEIAGELTPAVETVQKEFQNIVKSGELKKYIKTAVDSVKNIVSIAINLAKAVLPVVGKAVKFVADNFKTLAVVVGGAVVVFKAFKAVMAVTSAITAAKVAVAGLSAGVSVATKVQAGWNAVMAANPIGAVITAVALLAGGIALLIGTQEEEVEAQSHLNDIQQATVSKSKEVTDAFMEQREASKQLAAANTANVDYMKDSLLPELDDLVGANYEVKDADQARVNFILNELKNALGEEYGDLQNVIDQNGKVKDSVYEVIDAKKAQILLSTYEKDYADAVSGVAAAQAEAAEAAQDLAHWQEYLDRSYGDEDAKKQAQANYQAALETYTEAANKAKEYEDVIATYEAASTAALEGNTAKVVELFDKYTAGFKTAASVADKSKQEQILILDDQVMATQIAYRTLVEKHKAAWDSMTEDEQKAATKAEETAKKRADEAIEEWIKVGETIPSGLARGIDGNLIVIDQAMERLINSAVEAAKRAGEIRSPSRLFKRAIGVNIGLGIAEGIQNTTKSIVSVVKNQIRAVRGAYDFPTFSANDSNETNFGSGRGVTVIQNNHYSQAHSRYEIYQSKKEAAAAVRLALDTI